MPATVVISVDERLDTPVARLHVRIALQVDILVLERSPEAFDIDVVQRAALAIHRQLRRTVFVLEELRELFRSVLAALVGIEHLRPSVPAHGFQKHLYAEVRRQRVRQPPGKYPSAVPFYNRIQLH